MKKYILIGINIVILSTIIIIINNCRRKTEKIVYIELPSNPNQDIEIENDPRNSSEIENVFLPYVQEWENLHPDQKKVSTPISFADIPEDGVLGVCITWRNASSTIREIRIDQPTFTEIALNDPIAAKVIIFHELGHCELIRPHLDVISFNDSNTAIPFSIMASSLFSDTQVYTQHYDHYVEELFGGPGYLEPIGIKEAIHRTMTMNKGEWIGKGLIN